MSAIHNVKRTIVGGLLAGGIAFATLGLGAGFASAAGDGSVRVADHGERAAGDGSVRVGRPGERAAGDGSVRVAN